ncbi:MAG: hypothetical protein ACM31D_15075 [Bacteroidota bacterium]
MMEITGLEPQLRSLTQRLTRVLAGIEPVFTEAGGALADSVGHLDDLKRRFAAMAGRIEAEDVQSAVAALREVSAGLSALAERTAVSEQRLNDLHARAAALAPAINRLKKVIGEVQVLAVNAKVEAAHVTVRDVDFSVFTREIGRLAALAGTSLGRLADELSELLATLSAARRDLATFMREHRQSVAQVGAQLGQGLTAMADRSQQSAQAIRDLAELSGRMAGTVAHAVEGLQVGDMTRQRGEHVVEALQTLLEVAGIADLPPAHRATLVSSVCRLQAAQAESAAADLGRETAMIGSNLDALAADVAGLPPRCAAAYGAGGGGSFLAELGAHMQAAQHLLGVYAGAQGGIDRLVGQISQIVAGMVGHIEAIHSIEADMRVMGLNATFKCSRLGAQGRGLSVIAQELRAYSNRTAEDGSVIMGELAGLTQAAERMDREENSGQAAGQMEAAMASAVQVLDAVGADITASIHALSRGCAQVSQSLDKARRQMEAHPEFANTLADVARTLNDAVGTDIPDAAALGDIRAEVLDLLRTRYTMAAERKVHELLGGDEPGQAEAAATVDADDFLF